MHEADKIWNHFKGLRPVQKYNEANRYTLRMGTFVADVYDRIDYTSDLIINENSIEFNGRTYTGVLEDLLPEWLGRYSDKIKKLKITADSYETVKLIFTYMYTRFDYPVHILFDEFANWGLKGSKREFTERNIKALFEWANENMKEVIITQRDNQQSAVIKIISKP